jgi:hypothetical protein
MTKECMTAVAIEEILHAEVGGVEAPTNLRQRVEVAIQRCWRDDMSLDDLVYAVRRKLRNGFDGWAQ